MYPWRRYIVGLLAVLLLVFAPIALFCEISVQGGHAFAGKHCDPVERDFNCAAETGIKSTQKSGFGVLDVSHYPMAGFSTTLSPLPCQLAFYSFKSFPTHIADTSIPSTLFAQAVLLRI